MEIIVDIHTHILPGVDDGAENFDEAIEMLRIAQNNGTTDIVLTPHYLTRDMRGVTFSKVDISSRFEIFKEAVSSYFPKLNLYLGAETHAISNLYEAIEGDQIITINNTNYVLLEFGFSDHIRRAYNASISLMERGYIPIIAHPERYDFVKKDPLSIMEFVDLGALLQINSGSLAGDYGTASKDIALIYLDEGIATTVSSDGHSIFQRTPDLSEAFAFVSSAFSETYAEDLFSRNPLSIIRGKRV